MAVLPVATPGRRPRRDDRDHGVLHLGGDRVDDPLPGRLGGLQPFAAAPGGGRPPAAGNWVDASSHTSARSTAVSVAERSPSVTLGSPSETIWVRAVFITMSQLTGPSLSPPLFCIMAPSC